MIKCLECGKDYKLLTANHLKTHGLTLKSYQIKYPGSPIISSETSAKYSKNTKKLNENRDYTGIGQKISITKKKLQLSGIDYGATFRGKSMSDSQKELLRKTITEQYLNGRVHHNKGKHLSIEIRKKIANGVKQYSIPFVNARKVIKEAEKLEYKFQIKKQLDNKLMEKDYGNMKFIYL